MKNQAISRSFDLSNPDVLNSLALIEATKVMVRMTGTSKSRGRTKIFYIDSEGQKGSIDEEDIMPITPDEARSLIADASNHKPGVIKMNASTQTNAAPVNFGRRSTDKTPEQLKAEKDAKTAAIKAARDEKAASEARRKEENRAKREADQKAKADKAEADKAAKAKVAAEAKAQKEAEKAARAQARADRPAFTPGPAKGSTKIKDAPVDLSHYMLHPQKTASGRHVIDINDDVAATLRGQSIDEVYETTARALEVSVESLKEAYSHLNIGMQRMNLGNRIRGLAKAQETAERRERVKADKEARKIAADRIRAQKNAAEAEKRRSREAQLAARQQAKREAAEAKANAAKAREAAKANVPLAQKVDAAASAIKRTPAKKVATKVK